MGGDEKTYNDPESKEEKIPYPKAVFFIVGNELCERFSYYGMKAILTLYLKYQLLFSEDTSTVIYHVWSMLCYFTPLLGAIIADTFLGRFRTIFYISIIYVFGNAVLSVAAVPIFPSLGSKIAVSMVGLFLIALGTGGIKPCVSAFGGDQFVLPQQERLLTQFFSIFYFSINTGSLISTYCTPLLRDNVQCFGDDCYSLAFGVPAILMVCSLFLFLFGSNLYIKKPPGGNVLIEVGSIVSHALKRKRKTKTVRKHWLDHADDKFSKDLIRDVKILLKVLFLYIPLPVFWALFDQQGSRWTFQATRMDGEIGSFTIKPDQMQVVNPVFILTMIPVFDSIVYPLLAKCNILKRPLPRMFTGGLLAGCAFVISGCIELKLETTYPVPVEGGETRLTFINTLPCNVTLTTPWDKEEVTLMNLEEKIYQSINLDEDRSNLSASITFDTNDCGDVSSFKDNPQIIDVEEKTAYTVMITAGNTTAEMVKVDPADDYDKSSDGKPRLRMLFNLDTSIVFNSTVLLQGKSEDYFFPINESVQGYVSGTEFQDVESGEYSVYMPTSIDEHEDKPVGTFSVRLGGVYNFLVQKSLDTNVTNEISVSRYMITSENSVHMLWLIPQYFVITVSEVMFSITGLEFSFTQAPATMKSVLQAAWLLTVAVGNLIVVIIAEAKFFNRQSLEFFLFAGLMFVDMIIFAVLASRYTYVDEIQECESDHKSEQDGDNTSNNAGKDNEGFSDDETKF